jgi:acetyltransferase-like isoleucine patch superfamily enzyme
VIGKNIRHHLKLALTNIRVAARWDVLIEKNVTIKYWETLSFGEHCTLQSGVYVYGSRSGKRVTFDHHVVVAAGCTILGEGGCSFGAYTHLGPGVVVTSQYGDSTGERTTDSPGIKTLPVVVGAGCWVGSGAILMPGTDLGDNCIVAPSSVVYGKWPAKSKLSGNPARPARPATADA